MFIVVNTPATITEISMRIANNVLEGFIKDVWRVLELSVLPCNELEKKKYYLLKTLSTSADITQDNILMIVFLVISKYQMQSAHRGFAIVNAFTDLGSRYSRSCRNAGESINRNGSWRSIWYSVSSSHVTSTRNGLKI